MLYIRREPIRSGFGSKSPFGSKDVMETIDERDISCHPLKPAAGVMRFLWYGRAYSSRPDAWVQDEVFELGGVQLITSCEIEVHVYMQRDASHAVFICNLFCLGFLIYCAPEF